MRVITLALAGAMLASCTTTPQQATRSPDKQAEFAQLVAGKVAQKPISCLPHYQSGDMRVIDEDTVAFRDGGRRTFVAHMNGGCSNLGSGGTASEPVTSAVATSLGWSTRSTDSRSAAARSATSRPM